jgi:hypothetical protein
LHTIRRILTNTNLISGYSIQLQSMISSEFLTGITASELSIGRVQKRVQTCNDHYQCFSTAADNLLPKRLIDVNTTWQGNANGVRLTQQINGQRGKYVCLSHCWGSVPIHCSTKKETLADALEFIRFEALPKSFRGAIILTSDLEYSTHGLILSA